MNSDVFLSKLRLDKYVSVLRPSQSVLFPNLPNSTGSFHQGDIEPMLDDDGENVLLVPNNR
jgi:hypothetical protein